MRSARPSASWASGTRAMQRGAGLAITTLEQIAWCPWQAFLTRVLHVEPGPDALEALPAVDALLLGSVLHTSVEAIVKASLPEEEPSLEAALPARGRAVPWPSDTDCVRSSRRTQSVCSKRRALRPRGWWGCSPSAREPLLREVFEHVWRPAQGRPALFGTELTGALRVRDDDDRLREITFRADLAQEASRGAVSHRSQDRKADLRGKKSKHGAGIFSSPSPVAAACRPSPTHAPRAARAATSTPTRSARAGIPSAPSPTTTPSCSAFSTRPCGRCSPPGIEGASCRASSSRKEAKGSRRAIPARSPRPARTGIAAREGGSRAGPRPSPSAAAREPLHWRRRGRFSGSRHGRASTMGRPQRSRHERRRAAKLARSAPGRGCRVAHPCADLLRPARGSRGGCGHREDHGPRGAHDRVGAGRGLGTRRAASRGLRAGAAERRRAHRRAGAAAHRGDHVHRSRCGRDGPARGRDTRRGSPPAPRQRSCRRKPAFTSMRSRRTRAFGAGSAKALVGALDRLGVRTLHAFARRLLAAHPVEAGLHPAFEVDGDGRGAADVVA